MIEEACRGYRSDRGDSSGRFDDLLTCVQTIESRLLVLESNIQDLKTRSSVSETVHVNCIGKDTTPGLFIKAMKDLEIILPPKEESPVLPTISETDMEEEDADEAELNEKVDVDDAELNEEVEEVDAEVEEVEEVDAEEVDAEEEEADAEAEELEEITFKGKTYYKDSENTVYTLDDSGEPQPVGVWDVPRQRVLFKRV